MPSPATRLQPLGLAEFDVLVIGGGITGCGVARDAVLRGLRVALVEQGDIASGTSSRSSRLIHGGVRYLEHGHLRLVFEASTERRRLLRLAPHLVRPLAFTWPVYEGDRVPRWKLVAGLALYDALALFRNVRRHRWLSRRRVLGAEPRLRQSALTGGAVYFDAATDDARLTLANAVDAAALGAAVLTHVRSESLVRNDDGRATGAHVRDVLTGEAATVRARVVVQAVGPWTGGSVRGSTGVHISVPRDRLGNAGALTLTAPRDRRVMFTLPSGGHAIIGTTETSTASPPAEVRATVADVAYLLEAVNHYFPDAKLRRNDVVSAWAGVRPLVAGTGTLGSASREHAITETPGLLTITGGKLTTYRVMAADAVDAVQRTLGLGVTKSPTRDRPLPGGSLESVETEVEAARRETRLPVATAMHLVQTYGSAWRDVWAEAGAMPDGGAPLDRALPYLRAEVPYAARSEMAMTVGDVLIRRTHVAFERRDQGRALAPTVAALMAPVHGWDYAQQAREVERYAEEAARMFTIDP